VSLEKDDSGGVTDYLEQRSPVWSSVEAHCRTYTLDGRFLGVLRFNLERGQWQPEKVFL